MTFLYALLASLVVTSVLLIVLTPHVFYAALGLLCTLLGMAAIYFLQGASFVAVAHIIVYGGGVLVLALFSTLWLPLDTKPVVQKHVIWIRVGLVMGLWGGGLWPLVRFAVHTLRQQGTVQPPQADTVTGLGLQLLGPYALAFEWLGLSLLIALVGAAYLLQD